MALPEEELAIEVGDVDSVHVNDMDVCKAQQGQVGQDLAAQPSSANDEDLAFRTQELLCLWIFDISVQQA